MANHGSSTGTARIPRSQGWLGQLGAGEGLPLGPPLSEAWLSSRLSLESSSSCPSLQLSPSPLCPDQANGPSPHGHCAHPVPDRLCSLVGLSAWIVLLTGLDTHSHLACIIPSLLPDTHPSWGPHRASRLSGRLLWPQERQDFLWAPWTLSFSHRASDNPGIIVLSLHHALGQHWKYNERQKCKPHAQCKLF